MRTGGVARGTAAYAFATSAQRLVSFLLLPVYTRALDPGEYGQLAVIVTLGAAIHTLLSFGLETAVFRELVRLKDMPRERHAFINSVGLFALIVPAVLSVLVGAGAWLFVATPLNVPSGGLFLAILTAAIQASATVLPLAALRAEVRLREYVRVNLMATAVGAFLTITAVVILDFGVLGYIVANLCATAVLLGVGLHALGHRWTVDVNATVLWTALSFGLPMLPHALLHWALGLSDRIILGAFVDQSTIGVYSLAYQFAMPVSMLVVALNQAIMPRYARASVESNEVIGLGLIVTRQTAAVALMGLSVALLAPPIIHLLVPEPFWAAADLAPIIALGISLFGLYLIPMDTIVLVAGRTQWIWIATLAAATANVGLNLYLVPVFGALAAAWNTVVGYAVLLAAISLYLRTMSSARVRYDWPRLAMATATPLAAYAIAAFLPDFGPLPTIAIRLTLFSLVALIVIASIRPLDDQQRSKGLLVGDQ